MYLTLIDVMKFVSLLMHNYVLPFRTIYYNKCKLHWTSELDLILLSFNNYSVEKLYTTKVVYKSEN